MSAALSGGSSGSSYRQRDLTPVEYQDLRGPLADVLQQYGIQGDVPQIEGPFAAPLTDAERGALSQFQQSAFGPTGLGSAQENYIREALSGVPQNPFLGDTINAAVRPLIENEQLNELRSRSGFTNAGQKIQSSSAFAEDRARSLRDTERAIGDVSSQLAFQDQQLREAARVEAAQLATTRFTEMRESISALALPRLVEQLGIEGANQELARRFQVIENILGLAGSLSSPTLGSFGRSDSDSFATSGSYLGGTGG